MSRSGFHAPPGFRDSPLPAISPNEVVSSTYVMSHEIARTETGIVYEARDMMMERLVAFKLAWRDQGTPSLLGEARRCAAVRDPCAVAIHAMGSHQGVEYAVGERVSGVLLSALLGAEGSNAQTSEAYLSRLRRLVAAVARAHECGVAIGDISGATVLVDPNGRMVLGRLSLSQVPAFGRLGTILAPEVIRGDVVAGDSAAAEAIDLYGLGCIAVELARGTPPFAAAVPAIELRGHADDPPPRIGDLRTDLPEELSDLVDWLLAKQPIDLPRSAIDVLAQLDAIIERLGMASRSIRVLIVDHDAGRARWLWSLARRAYPSAIVETAGDSGDAVHKLNRDHPDLVVVDANLRGVMNSLEFVMYARGLETEHRVHIALVGEVGERDRLVFDDANVTYIAPGPTLPSDVIDRVRMVANKPTRRRKPRKTITG